MNRIALASATLLALLAQDQSVLAESWGSPVKPFGLYSAAHTATVEGQRVLVKGYVYIARDGLITAYAARASTTGTGECYVAATGPAVNAALQGRTLRPGRSPNDEPDYEVKAGDVTFGILAEPGASGNVRWFVHTASRNNTANITGIQDVVAVGSRSFAITGAPLSSPTLGELQSQMCDD